MNDHLQTLNCAAAFIAGLVGSGHCVAMCGGMAGALGMRARAMAGGSMQHAFVNMMNYHIGRIMSYASAGAVFGLAGSAVQRVLDVVHLTMALRVVSGLLIVAVAMRVLFDLRLLARVERLGGKVWARLSPLARQTKTRSVWGQALLLGAIWGWLPCGLVYSMLVMAAVTTGPLHGALVMISFGAGTLPSMLSTGLLASRLAAITSRPAARVISGLTLIFFGLWTALAPFQHLHAHVH